ncbi:hypothetical protein K501DRAFT_270856 [Backusella circina FSU 941]|nr:hypothetical protein K501DRAFT_270856 [Backusella circina FSU 941]
MVFILLLSNLVTSVNLVQCISIIQVISWEKGIRVGLPGHLLNEKIAAKSLLNNDRKVKILLLIFSEFHQYWPDSSGGGNQRGDMSTCRLHHENSWMFNKI